MSTGPAARARSEGAQYVGPAASGLHTVPHPDRDGTWRVYSGRLGDPAASFLGTLTAVSLTSWVATPPSGQPFGWAGDRDDAARQLAVRPFGIRLTIDPPTSTDAEEAPRP